MAAPFLMGGDLLAEADRLHTDKIHGEGFPLRCQCRRLCSGLHRVSVPYQGDICVTFRDGTEIRIG